MSADATAFGSHAAAGDAEVHQGHEDLSFREQVRERIIGLRSMDRRLRLVVGAAIAQLVAVAIMLALRDANVPMVAGNGDVLIPVATFVVAVVFLTVSLSFMLAGALHAHWAVRVLVFALVGWAFFVESDTVTDRIGGEVAALALLAAILGVGIVATVRDRRRGGPAGHHLFASRVLLLLPLVGGLYITAWLSSASADNLDNFTTSVGQQIYYLQYALIPALVVAGADFADWGHLLGTRAGAALGRVRNGWPLLLGTVAVAAAMLVDARRVLDVDFKGALGLGALLVAAVVFLVAVARPRTEWSTRFPFAALAIVAVLDATEGFVVEQRIGGSDDYVSDHIFAISAVLWAVLGLAAVAVLVVRRGKLRSSLVAGLSFVALVGVCNALFGLDSVGRVFPSLHLSGDTVPLDLDGVRAAAAIATLAVVALVVVTGRVRRSGRLISGLLALDVGIQVLAWVDALFNRTQSASQTLTRGLSIVAGVILLMALVLEILGSGEAITNRHDRWLPRPSRVLLYLGYVVMVAAAVLYFASLHDPSTHAVVESQFDSESWVQEGVGFLGVPLVATLFIANLRPGRRARVETAASG